MTLLIFYILLVLILSFLCSLAESALLATPISFVNMKETEGSKSAKILKKYKDNIDHPLAAILTINTIAHTVGAAGVGAQVTAIWGNEYFGIASAILTIMRRSSPRSGSTATPPGKHVSSSLQRHIPTQPSTT